eukprot:Gb_20291 [translate_table: standard]
MGGSGMGRSAEDDQSADRNLSFEPSKIETSASSTEFDQESSLILKRALRVGDDRSEVQSPQSSENTQEVLGSCSSAKPGFRIMNTAGCPPSASSSSGHLDPCAQEFTPSPYSLLHPPAPLYYPYVHAQAGAGSIPVNPSPVVSIYNTREMGMHYATIGHPWDSRQLRVGMQGDHVGPPCISLVPGPPQPANRPYRYTNNIAPAVPRTSGAMGSNPGQQQSFVSTSREHASRALLLSSVPNELSEADMKEELETWGPVRALQMEKRSQGFVTVHYYDLRHAKTALTEIQEQHLMQQRRLHEQYYNNLLLKNKHKQLGEDADGNDEIHIPPPPPPRDSPLSRGLIGGKVIWAQYTIPVGLPPGPDSYNQGTLVVFNLDADVTTETLKSIFEVFGAVKELRETPTKRQHKFVEFFDVRDAARALAEMDGQEIGGKRVKIEFSRPGGHTRRPFLHASPPLHPSPPTLNNNNNMAVLISHDPHQLMYQLRWNATNQLESTWNHSPLANADLGTMSHPGGGMNTRGRGPGRGCVGRANSSNNKSNINNQHQHPHSSSNNNCNGRLIRGGIEGGIVRKRRGNGSQPRSEHSAEANSIAATSKSTGNAFGSKNGNARMYSETASHFAFDEAKAESNCSDARTTVMIKNIPNKYSQQMLLSMLDQHCISCNERITDPNEPLSAYDFVYLPIDFKNKCNLGYAFVNLTSSKATWKLYKAFHAQPWEAFNSRKICEVTYARVQGRAALEDHFRNSKFACDTDEYLPVVFFTPRNGEQLSTPVVMGGHIFSQSNALKNNNVEEDSQSKVLVTTSSDANSNKCHVPTTNVYRQTVNNYHRSSNVHEPNNFPLGRRVNGAVQERPMSGGNNISRVGSA